MIGAPETVAATRAYPRSRVHAPGSRLIIASGYASLVVVTVILKWFYLAADSYGGLREHLAFMARDSGLAGASLAALFFAVEPFEAFVLFGLGVAVGRFLAPSTVTVVATVVLIATLLGGLDFLAYREMGSLLTVDTVALAARWAWMQPGAAWHFVTWRRLLGLALAVAGAIAPIVTASGLSRSGRIATRHVRIAELVLLVLVASSAVVAGALIVTTGRYPVGPLRGYWSSAVAAFTRLDQADPTRVRRPDPAELRREYLTLAFPEGLSGEPIPLVEVSDDARRPRHVLVVSLETAAHKYYPIDEMRTPTLARMSRHALTSERHFAAVPTTGAAIFGIVTGLYPYTAVGLGRYGLPEGEGLGTILAPRGYAATYIDSYAIDWEGGKRARTLLQGLGFTRLLDTWTDARIGEQRGFANASLRDELSFKLALQSVLDAQAHGRKAFVVLVTNLGHYPWFAPAGEERLSATDRLTRIARRIDDLLGSFLSTLSEQGLGNDIIVVVAGDHGLRFRREFEMLGESPEHGELEFNVPLLVYAPSVFRERVALPYVTSHVDLAPTLLDLLGVGVPSGTILHGLSLLDRRLENRVTFLMSGGIAPVNGLHWRGRLYAADVAGRVTVRPLLNGGRSPDSVLRPREVRRILDRAEAVFLRSAAYYVQGGRSVASR